MVREFNHQSTHFKILQEQNENKICNLTIKIFIKTLVQILLTKNIFS